MASILIPPDRSAALPTKEEQQLALWADTGPAGLDLTPHLLLQLEDDLERSRLREAFWISVVVHLMVVILIAMSPKIFGYKGIDLATTADLMKNQNMTYLDLPSDLQKPPKVAPKTNAPYKTAGNCSCLKEADASPSFPSSLRATTRRHGSNTPSAPCSSRLIETSKSLSWEMVAQTEPKSF